MKGFDTLKTWKCRKCGLETNLDTFAKDHYEWHKNGEEFFPK